MNTRFEQLMFIRCNNHNQENEIEEICITKSHVLIFVLFILKKKSIIMYNVRVNNVLEKHMHVLVLVLKYI